MANTFFNKLIRFGTYVILFVLIKHGIALGKHLYCHRSLLNTILHTGNPICILATRIEYGMDNTLIWAWMIFYRQFIHNGLFSFIPNDFHRFRPNDVYQRSRSNRAIKSS